MSSVPCAGQTLRSAAALRSLFGHLLAAALLVLDCVQQVQATFATDPWSERVASVFLMVVFAYLIGSSLVYQLCRCVCAWREHHLRALGFSETQPFGSGISGVAPRLTFLIPSYKEEPEIVRYAVLSAALQASPKRNVVLLIDDPVEPQLQADRDGLDRMRRLPAEVAQLLAAPRWQVASMWPAIAARGLPALVDAWVAAARWFEAEQGRHAGPAQTACQRVFCERVLQTRARDLRAHAGALAACSRRDVDLPAEYRRLQALFCVELSGFERKRYGNLSHEPNKAMNLNGYLQLIGRSWNEVPRDAGLCIEICEGPTGAFSAPDAQYVVALDADSVLDANYTLQLVGHMQRPCHARCAIVQTPYATMPGAATYLERIAGAQTDAMYWSHQGLTAFGAASWVGAAAVLRVAALREVAETTHERCGPVTRYVKDKTVTEDADTTLDLLLKGWHVHNHPTRLCYSATPADFGAFLIQRRRWATGGILIVPKLLRYFGQQPGPARALELLLRLQYLLSGGLGSVAVLVLLAYPFTPRADVPWLLVAAGLVYAGVQVAEARQLGRRGRDFIGLYALGLSMLPINISGIAHSLRQCWTGQREAFGRTPKISMRTAVPWHHLLAQCALLALLAGKAVSYGWVHHNAVAAAGAAVSLAFMVFGVSRFIGWGDIAQGWRGFAAALRPRATVQLDSRWEP